MVVAALAATAFVGVTTAEAQSTTAEDELASIEAEATAATALYVTGPILMTGGTAAAIGIGLANLCVSSCGDRTGVEVGVGVSLALAATGLLMFIPAIVLDVDSGSRRRRLRERGSVDFSWGFAPTPDGVSFALASRF